MAEVNFHGWTHGDRVRQASFQGLREDKSANEVVREVKAAAATTKAPAKRSAVVKTRNADTVGKVKLTHPDRVYWQDAGITKRDLADYYSKVWKWMRPHVAGRPISLVRCPEGAEGQCFFQKHARAGIPTEFLHLVPEKGDKIISIDDLDGLIALVQGGVLEVHTRGTTIDDRERGDRLVFDLDPGPGTGWRDVVEAAREVRARLKRIKLESFLKTSGGKGLHVVLPIKPEPWETVKRFCRAVAESMEKDEPGRYVSTAAKARRNKRIFVDYLRNSREATAVAPYSTRARPGAPVSMPIAWSELGSLKSADQYTVKNAMQRLARQRKDPWAAIGRSRAGAAELQIGLKRQRCLDSGTWPRAGTLTGAAMEPGATMNHNGNHKPASQASQLFSRFAQATAQWTGHPVAFLGAILIVLIWIVTGPMFNYSDTWQLVINTGTTIVTFLMVFLIQNTQNRDILTVQLKLSELVLAMKGAENRFAAIEDLTDEELEELHEECRARAETTFHHLEQRRGKEAGPPHRRSQTIVKCARNNCSLHAVDLTNCGSGSRARHMRLWIAMIVHQSVGPGGRLQIEE